MRRCAVLSTGQLRADHLAALERLHSSVTVERRCEDLAELIAVARAIRADAALIIGETQKLTSSVLHGLADQGLTVVAVSEVAAERGRLRALGVSCFDDEVGAEQLAEALADLQPGAAGERTALGDQFAELMLTHQLAGQVASEYGVPEPKIPEPAPPPGLKLAGVTVVWGAAGSPGRTTVAVNLAAELVLSGARCLLIDADTYAAAVAVHLGLMQESAGLAQACRAAEVSGLTSAALAQASTTVLLGEHRLAVLTGLPRAQRWTELRSHPLEQVLIQARADYDHIIIDVAPWIEQDEDWVSEVDAAPQRNSAARTVLTHADTVLALGGADPVGFSRLVKAVQELPEMLPQAPAPTVIVTQLRKDVIGRSPRRQLSEAWEQLGASGSIHDYLPWDQRACDAALRAGQVLAEAEAESGLRRQIAALAGIELPVPRRLLGSRAANRRRRRARLESAAFKG